MLTASTTTQCAAARDFSEGYEKPAIGGVGSARFVSAKDRFDL
jgi:hypothetical protein